MAFSIDQPGLRARRSSSDTVAKASRWRSVSSNDAFASCVGRPCTVAPVVGETDGGGCADSVSSSRASARATLCSECHWYCSRNLSRGSAFGFKPGHRSAWCVLCARPWQIRLQKRAPHLPVPHAIASALPDVGWKQCAHSSPLSRRGSWLGGGAARKASSTKSDCPSANGLVATSPRPLTSSKYLAATPSGSGTDSSTDDTGTHGCFGVPWRRPAVCRSLRKRFSLSDQPCSAWSADRSLAVPSVGVGAS